MKVVQLAVIIALTICLVSTSSAVVGYQRFSMDLRNVGILLQHYTSSQPRRPRPGFQYFCLL